MKLTVAGRTYGIQRDVLEKVAQATFSYLRAQEQEGDIELKFVGTGQIAEINRRYRSVDGPTDVLSFLLTERPLVGQIFICYNYTAKQSKATGRHIEDELALLTVHGILHLFGYDHEKLEDERKMQEIEKTILKTEGFTR